VVAAIKSGELYVFTHPEYRQMVADRMDTILSAFDDSAQLGYVGPQDPMVKSKNPFHVR
jgi:hypothetical protein